MAVAGLLFVPLLALQTWVVTLLPRAWVPACGLKRWTGLPCPTCGAYRAARALVQGEWLRALRLQPLLVTGSVLLLLLFLYALATALLRRPRLHVILTRRERHGLAAAGLLLVAANWLYLLLDGR